MMIKAANSPRAARVNVARLVGIDNVHTPGRVVVYTKTNFPMTVRAMLFSHDHFLKTRIMPYDQAPTDAHRSRHVTAKSRPWFAYRSPTDDHSTASAELVAVHACNSGMADAGSNLDYSRT